jgi:flagellar protein FlaI
VAGGPAEISLFDLLKAALRQRPDYIIVGEVRGAETYTLFQAMATGHGGLSSIHADSVGGMINRLETEPMNIPHALISTLDMVAMVTRARIGDRPARRIERLSEIVATGGNPVTLSTNEAFRWNPADDQLSHTGKSEMIEKIKARRGISQEDVDRELTRRRVVLEWMLKEKIRRYREVALVIRDYYNDPSGTFDKARLGLLS